VVQTGGSIYPGLIELHNHLAYDALPLWQVPERYDNRDDWGSPNPPYSVYGQAGGERHAHDPAIAAYPNRWLDTLAANNHFEAITLGSLAETAYETWKATPSGQSHTTVQAALTHPTYPESEAASGQTTLVAATAAMLANWNHALPTLHAAITHPDTKVPVELYGTALVPTDDAPIPEADVPPGLPTWMRGLKTWAERTGPTPHPNGEPSPSPPSKRLPIRRRRADARSVSSGHKRSGQIPILRCCVRHGGWRASVAGRGLVPQWRHRAQPDWARRRRDVVAVR
jgi:hypothetical protein